jgi:hypothetical protein
VADVAATGFGSVATSVGAGLTLSPATSKDSSVRRPHSLISRARGPRRALTVRWCRKWIGNASIVVMSSGSGAPASWPREDFPEVPRWRDGCVAYMDG